MTTKLPNTSPQRRHLFLISAVTLSTVLIRILGYHGCGAIRIGCAASAEQPVKASLRVESEEIGEASWYGPGFHGKLAANGEIYNMHELTAAHRTLPLGSTVRVTNLQNGKSIQVRITDRGPYVDGRIIDLSRGAAGALDMLEDGITEVRVELLAPYQ